MNKVDFVAAVAEKAGISKKDAGNAVDAFTTVVTEALIKGEKVSLVGFGTFEVKERAAREGRNPQTGDIRDEIRTDSVMSKISKEDLETIADIVSKYTTKEKPNLDFSNKNM